MNPTRMLTLALLPILAAPLLAGCGTSPTAPQITAVQDTASSVIHTPTKLILQQIVLRKFPATTTSGDDWDSSLIVNARKPDLYVELRQEGYTPIYSSDVRENATAGNTYRFTEGYGTPNLPLDVPYGSAYRVYVWDRDVGGDNDRLGWITLNLPAAYPRNNSFEVDHTYRDSAGRIEVEIIGQWSY